MVIGKRKNWSKIYEKMQERDTLDHSSEYTGRDF